MNPAGLGSKGQGVPRTAACTLGLKRTPWQRHSAGLQGLELETVGCDLALLCQRGTHWCPARGRLCVALPSFLRAPSMGPTASLPLHLTLSRLGLGGTTSSSRALRSLSSKGSSTGGCRCALRQNLTGIRAFPGGISSWLASSCCRILFFKWSFCCLGFVRFCLFLLLQRFLLSWD